MKALVFSKSISRYLLLKALGQRYPHLATGRWGFLRLKELTVPELPNEEWVLIRSQMSGICGSDLSVLTAKGSPYFSPLTSTPFVMGHENLGRIEKIGPAVQGWTPGERVVIQPALGCEVRGNFPPCKPCSQGQVGNCEKITQGVLAPGVQTGYCASTGGGWGDFFLAHCSQLFRVPEKLSDEVAVLTEPFACSLHSVLKLQGHPSDSIIVVGCGSIGLLTLSALKLLGIGQQRIALAKYPHQQDWAKRLGATKVLRPGKKAYSEIAQILRASLHYPEIGPPVLLGGADVVFDCVGSPSSIDLSLRLARPRGRVLLVGMPGFLKGVDGTSIWHQELVVEGCYTYGVEEWQGNQWKTFDLALRFLEEEQNLFTGLVGARFPLEQYPQALRTALHTGQSGVVKTVFDLRKKEAERSFPIR